MMISKPKTGRRGGGLVAKSCPTLATSWSLPGSSVHAILQARLNLNKTQMCQKGSQSTSEASRVNTGCALCPRQLSIGMGVFKVSVPLARAFLCRKFSSTFQFYSKLLFLILHDYHLPLQVELSEGGNALVRMLRVSQSVWQIHHCCKAINWHSGLQHWFIMNLVKVKCEN